MSLLDGVSLLENVFITSSFLSTYMVPQVIITFATLMFLSRSPSEWKQLAFPVLVGWNAFGFYISPILLFGSGVLMVLDIFSPRDFASGFNIIKGTFGGTKQLYRDVRKTVKVGPKGILAERKTRKQLKESLEKTKDKEAVISHLYKNEGLESLTPEMKRYLEDKEITLSSPIYGNPNKRSKKIGSSPVSLLTNVRRTGSSIPKKVTVIPKRDYSYSTYEKKGRQSFGEMSNKMSESFKQKIAEFKKTHNKNSLSKNEMKSIYDSVRGDFFK